MPKFFTTLLTLAALFVAGNSFAQTTPDASSETLFDVLAELDLSRCGMGRRTRCEAQAGEIHCVRRQVLRSRHLHRCEGRDLPGGRLHGLRAKALFDALALNGVELDCGGHEGKRICAAAALSAHCQVVADDSGHEHAECYVDPAPAFSPQARVESGAR